MHKNTESFILQSETTHFLVFSGPLWHLKTDKNGGQVEVRLARGTLLGSKITSVGLPWCSKNSTNRKARIKHTSSPKGFGQFFVVTYPFNFFHCRCYAQNTESLILQSESTHFLVFTDPLWHLKTDVRSTSDCEAGPFWCPKSHLRAFLVLARS